MSYTDETVSAFVALAGEDFSWAGVRGVSRIPSSYLGRKGFRALVRADLLARQGGICPVCGDEVPEGSGEFNHGVARGPECKGWIEGNIYVGHATCNTACKERGPVVYPADMARPDAVPSEWTPFPILARS